MELRTEYWVLRGGIGGVSATFAVKTFSLQCHTKPQSGLRFLCTHFYLYLTIVNNIFRIISRIPATKHEWRMSFRNRNMCFSGLALKQTEFTLGLPPGSCQIYKYTFVNVCTYSYYSQILANQLLSRKIE